MPGHTGIRRFTTKRFLFSLIGLALSTGLCYYGKLGGEQWVYALAIVLAGHHAEDLVRAYRGNAN